MRHFLWSALIAGLGYGLTAVSLAAQPAPAGSWQADDPAKPTQLTYASTARAEVPSVILE